MDIEVIEFINELDKFHRNVGILYLSDRYCSISLTLLLIGVLFHDPNEVQNDCYTVIILN
jgi:hypothetical protein